MFNDTGIKTQSYGNTTQILFAVEHQVSVGCLVNESMGVDEDGKKIVKAGTPLSGDLTKRETAFTKASDSDAVGVLLHDVDVTNGDNNGTCLIFGFVNLNRIDDTTQALITEGVIESLNMIKFIKA